jgi:hypothetical protein
MSCATLFHASTLPLNICMLCVTTHLRCFNNSSSGSYEAALLSASPALQFRDLHEPAGSSSTATAAAMAALPPELQLKMEMRGHMDMHRQMLLRQHDQLQLHGTAAAPTAAEAAAAVAAAAATAAGAGGSSSSSGDSGGSAAAAAAAADGLLAAGAGSDSSRRASTAADSGKASADVSSNVLSMIDTFGCSQHAFVQSTCCSGAQNTMLKEQQCVYTNSSFSVQQVVCILTIVCYTCYAPRSF